MTSPSAAWSCTPSAEQLSQPPDSRGAAANPGPGVPPAPAAAELLFGSRLPLIVVYATLLAGAGIRRGLIGPHEVPRLWDRHLLNCAVIAEAFPTGARVVDVGTGAGLPGIVLACLRPDLRIDLVDSLKRRTMFLHEAVEVLELVDRVRVVTGRAEEAAVRSVVGHSHWVTARAVAPLDRLAGWCLPLLASGGTLVAMKGSSAAAEVASAKPAIRRLGGTSATVVDYGQGVIEPATRTVHIVRQ